MTQNGTAALEGARPERRLIMRRIAAGLAVLLLVLPATAHAAADESPIHFFKRLFSQPVEAVRHPTTHRRAAAKPKAMPATIPTPPPRPGTADAAPTERPTPAKATTAEAPPPESAAPEPKIAETKTPEAATAAAPATRPAPIAQPVPARKSRPPAGTLTAADLAASPPAPVRRPQTPPTGLAITAPHDIVPTPRHRPDHAPQLAMVAPPAAVAPLARAPARAAATCSAAIAALHIEAMRLAPIDEDRCQVPEPLAVSALDGGITQFTTKAIVNCAMATALAGWLKGSVDPAAARNLGGRITGLHIAASYACRNRDNLPNAKLSEHAFANAIDISAFQVDGKRWVAVGGDHDTGETAFLASVRKAACGPFTTVLGPGTDSFHTDHFHLDLARRGRKGHSLYCR